MRKERQCEATSKSPAGISASGSVRDRMASTPSTPAWKAIACSWMSQAVNAYRSFMRAMPQDHSATGCELENTEHALATVGVKSPDQFIQSRR